MSQSLNISLNKDSRPADSHSSDTVHESASSDTDHDPTPGPSTIATSSLTSSPDFESPPPLKKPRIEQKSDETVHAASSDTDHDPTPGPSAIATSSLMSSPDFGSPPPLKKLRIDQKTDTKEFTEKNVFNAVKQVANWEVLGIQLGFKSDELNIIKRDTSDTSGALIRLVGDWMRNDKNASWRSLARALRLANYKLLADSLYNEDCADAFSSARVIIKMKNEDNEDDKLKKLVKTERVEEKPLSSFNSKREINHSILRLENKFGLIVQDTKEEILSDERKIRDFFGTIKHGLPQPLKGLTKFVTHTYLTRDNFDSFFTSVERMWSFIDYELLEAIIHGLPIHQLTVAIDDYIDEVKKFCAQTTIYDLIENWNPRYDRQAIPEELKICVTELSFDIKSSKVEELKKIQRKLKDSFPQELAMAAFYIYDVAPGSLRISWLVWAECLPDLIDRLKDLLQSDSEFITDLHLSYMLMDNVILYSTYNDQNPQRDILYIEIEDMKHRYRNPKNQKKRISAFIQALIVNYPGLHVAFCIKQHNIAEFILKGESINGEENRQPVSDEEREFVKKYLYGEICAPENNKKYRPSKKPSREAWAEMPADTQRELQQQQARHSLLTEEALEKHDLKSGPVELRQFACLPCNNTWWRTVLKTKPVSRCKGSICDGQRYDALPIDKEFGIGRFVCPNPNCERVFYGHCEATNMLTCRKCGTPSKPHIHPKWIKRARKKRQQLRMLNPDARTFKSNQNTQIRPENVGPQFYPVSQYELTTTSIGIGSLSLEDSPTHLSSVAHPPQPPLPLTTSAAPMPTRRRKKRVFNPSMPHIPTGSTASTFLSQYDFDRMGTEVDLDYDDEIDEYAVGACMFECQNCRNEYTSLVRMADTAPCFRCETDNNPLHWAPPREIEHRTTNQHTCSRCPTMGECPNLQEAKFKMEDIKKLGLLC